VGLFGVDKNGHLGTRYSNVVPELVGKNAAGEPNSVFYSQLSVLLLAELKILKARVAVLEAG